MNHVHFFQFNVGFEMRQNFKLLSILGHAFLMNSSSQHCQQNLYIKGLLLMLGLGLQSLIPQLFLFSFNNFVNENKIFVLLWEQCLYHLHVQNHWNGIQNSVKAKTGTTAFNLVNPDLHASSNVTFYYCNGGFSFEGF